MGGYIVSRYDRILGVQKPVQDGKLTLIYPHWDRVLRATRQLYGQHSVTSIFNFLVHEGAEIGLQPSPGQGYKLLPGRFTPRQWEEIKKEILVFLRDDIVKVLELAWTQAEELSVEQKNESIAPVAKQLTKQPLEATKDQESFKF
jgi:hypothetical protein